MRRLPAVRPFLAAILLALTGNLAATPHADVAPIPAQAVQVIRAAQHDQDDRLASTLNRHLRESKALFERAMIVVQTLRTKGAEQAEDTVLTTRHAQASAKRQEVEALREEVMQRLDERIAAAGGTKADRIRAFKAKLNIRFDALSDDLKGMESGDAPALAKRARQAARHIEAWTAERPVAPIPTPNWENVRLEATRGEEPGTVQPLSRAPAPRFVADSMTLLAQRFGAGAVLVPAVLRATPSEAASCGYNANDLAETPEVQTSHPDIQALAAGLDYNPVRMADWVNRNIAFEPYFGSRKGAVATLWAKAGGATDQASLLIALYRAANIPARYVRGQVRVSDPQAMGSDGRGPRWIGTTSYKGAADVIARNGNPSATYYADGVGLQHVWVEACLPYAAYRGVALDDAGHRWVPLDPSFKDNRYQAGVVLDAGFDFDYDTWLASRIDGQGRYRLPQEAFEDEALANARTKAPLYGNTTLADIPYRSLPNPLGYDILPIVLPYEILSYDSWSGVAGQSAETASLPDRHRHLLEVSVRTSGASLLSQTTINLTQVATSRLTLSFKGATGADQSAFDSWLAGADPSADPVCAGSANMVPVLMLGGVEQAKSAGSGSTALCAINNQLDLTVRLGELSSPVIKSVHYANIATANVHALHAWVNHTSDTYLAKRTGALLDAIGTYGDPNVSAAARDATEGEFLNIAAAKYMRYVADANKRVGGLFGEAGTSGVSLGLTSGQVKVNYLFDLPYGLFRKGFLIDWPGNVYTGGAKLDGGSTDSRAFKLGGFAGSAYEAFIWQEMAGLDAVSTTRGIQFAAEKGIEVLEVNSSNWASQKARLTSNADSTLNYSPTHVSQIETNFINQGYTLTIPRSLIRYPDDGAGAWLGAAFYAEDLAGGHLSFPINGYSGGVTVEPSTGSSPDGSNSGGYTGGSSPFDPIYDGGYGVYDPVGSGYVPEGTAPTFAQGAGQNSTTTSNGNVAGLTTTSGDPVNMLTGNLIHTERDISIRGRGGLPIVFERWYNSKAPKDGPLGYGWTHSFNHFLRFYGVEGGQARVSWNDGTGGERFFATANHASGNISTGASFSAPAGIYATVERLANGTYRITERSGLKYVFESVTAGATDTGLKARLVSITDRNGNALNLSYAAIGGCPGTYVCQVTDALGRALTFSYTGTHLSGISDWSGRQWQYGYDGNGNLVSVKNPLAVAGSQAPVTYDYYTAADGAGVDHAMRKYVLPRGNGMHFDYYANGRVFKHTPFDTSGALLADHATTFVWNEFRRESRQVDAEGHERIFEFDPYGNPIAITDEAGAKHQYTYYESAGQTHLRKSKIAPNGLTTQYAYDTAGNLTDVTAPSGRTVQYRDYTAFGQAQRIQNANGHWTLRVFDAAGNLTDEIRTRAGVTPSAGVKPATGDIVAWTQYQADSAGNPTRLRRLRDWSGASLGNPASGVGPSLDYAYDATKLNLTSTTRRGDLNGTPSSLETEVYSDYQYDTLGRMTRGPDAHWYAADTRYDALDRPDRTPDGRGNQWDLLYDANGNPVNAGLTIGGEYLDGYYANWDALDRQERKVDYAGNATVWRYDRVGHLEALTGADGYRIGFERDPLGRIEAAYDEAGHRVVFSRDADGKPRSVTDPNQLTTNYAYYHASEDGRLKTTTLPKVSGQNNGRAVQVAAYDGAGRPLRVDAIAADGTVRDSYRFYDELGRLVRSVGPQVSALEVARPVTCYVYTALGDLSEVWAGSTTDISSSACNLDGVNVKRQFNASFDDFGRKLTETDALGNTWRWSWNRHNQLVSTQSPEQVLASQSTTYAYGTAGISGETQGLIKQRSVPGVQTVSYVRDALGRITQVDTKDGAGIGVIRYDYTYDAASRIRTVTDSRAAKTLTYTWSPGGRLSKVEDSDGHTTSYAYDAVGRLATITAPNGQNIGFTFDAGGRLIEQKLDSGLRTTQSWFEDGSLEARTNLYGTSTRSSHSYTLDAFGRRATQSENVAGSIKAWSYQYDNLDRLLEANDGTAETYGYDIWGNRRSVAKGGTTTAYLYDAAHQLSEIRSGSDTGSLIGAAIHDKDGHLTRLCQGTSATKSATTCTSSGTGAYALQMQWDALDRINTVTRTGTGAVTESYTYDDSGRRIKKTSAGTSTHYLYDGDAIHAEWAGSMAGAPSAAYTHGAGIDSPILRLTGTTNSPAATQVAYLQDGLGSVVGTMNTGGTLAANQRFDAWGNKTASSGTVPAFGYTGREPDATGLVFYRARYYHPGVGRFMSRDPAGMVDAVSPYAYVGNNPVGYVDPYGWAAMDPAQGGVLNAIQSYWGKVAEWWNAPGVTANMRNAQMGLGARHAELATQAYQNGEISEARYELEVERARIYYGEAANLPATNGDVAVTGISVLPAIGSAGATIKSASQELKTLFRVVDDAELASIRKTGSFQTVPGQFEGKQFVDNLEDAQKLQKKFSDFFGGNQTIVKGKAPQSVLDSANKTPFSDIPNGTAITVPKTDLPQIKPEF